MGTCMSRNKAAKIAIGHRETVVLAVEMRYPCCSARARKVWGAARKCRGVQHVAFHRFTGLLTAVGAGLDPEEIRYWVERKCCGRATVVSHSPAAAEAHSSRSINAGRRGRGGGADAAGRDPGCSAGSPHWPLPFCVPACAPPPPPYYGYCQCPCSCSST